MTNKQSGASCELCPFSAKNYKLVPGGGPSKPKLVVVTDYPNHDDAHYNQLVSGDAGILLRSLLRKFGIDPVGSVVYHSLFGCWPKATANTKANRAKAAEACQQVLHNALASYSPDTKVLVLGRLAQQALSIDRHDYWTQLDTGKWAIAGYSPGQVLRSPGRYAYLENTIRKMAIGPKEPVDFGAKEVEVNPYNLPDLNQNFGRICIDIETTGLDWTRDEAFLVGIAFEKREQGIIFTKDYLTQPGGEAQAWLQALINRHGDKVGGHNYKFDALFLHREFGVPLHVGWDTMLMVNVINEYWYKSLKDLLTYIFNVDDYSDRLVKDWLKAEIARHKAEHKRRKANGEKLGRWVKPDLNYSDVPEDMMTEYLKHDIFGNLELSFILEKWLRKLGQWDMPYQGHEIPQNNMLARCELRGFAVDLNQMTAEASAMGRDEELLKEQVTALSNGIIKNPNSTEQVRTYLYDYEGRTAKSKTATGKKSVDREALEANSDLPAIQALSSFRRVSKLKSSFLTNVFKFIRKDNEGVKRVHPSYKQAHVITHRLSAENPPVQTIPHKDAKKDTVSDTVVKAIEATHGAVEFQGDYGTRIKNCYVAAPGHILITMDGAGWELTVATAQSRDDYFMSRINNGLDPHGPFCDFLFGEGQWTKADRVKQKQVTFGWQYKGSVNAFVKQTGLPRSKVQALVDHLNETCPKHREWQDRTIQGVLDTGKIVIPFFNYTLKFDLITEQVLYDLPKTAVNYGVQGPASMIICRAAYLAQEELERLGAYIVALVHDDYTIEVPEKRAHQAAQVMKKWLEIAGNEFSDAVRWGVEFKVGKRWGQLEELTLEEIKEQYQ